MLSEVQQDLNSMLNDDIREIILGCMPTIVTIGQYTFRSLDDTFIKEKVFEGERKDNITKWLEEVDVTLF